MEDEDESDEAAPKGTLREMMFPNNLDFRPLGVILPAIAEDLELKPSFIQTLPKFSAMPREDPWRHVQDFEMVCGTVRAEGQKAECIRLISFPLSLHDGAREWFYALPKGSVKTWGTMQQKFLERYCPASRIANARKEIYTLQMGTAESLYGYWIRYKDMLAKCPLHQIPDQDLIHFFICGLRAFELRLINVACGGSILGKSPSEAFRIIAEMAEEFREEGSDVPKASPSAPCPTLLDEEAEENVEKGKEDVLPRNVIEDDYDQVIQRRWAEHRTLSKEVPKAPNAEVEIHQSTLPMQTPTMSMENERLPSPRRAIEEEGKIQDPLGQEATDWTLVNSQSISPSGDQHYISLKEAVPARDLQRKLDMTKKLLALVIMRLNPACQRESPARALPKKPDTMVVQNIRKKLLLMKVQGDWGVSKGHQNFVWDPGQGDPDGR